MLITTPALVLNSIRYRDADLISKCYTRKSGLKTYMLRGILKSKRSKLRPSYFQPLNQLEIVANHRDKDSMEYLREVRVLHSAQELQRDVFKSAIALFLAECLRNAIQEKEANPRLFDFLSESFQYLNAADYTANFHLSFLIKLSGYLGFYPDYAGIGQNYFDLMEGNFQGNESSKYSLSEKNTGLLKEILGKPYAQAEKIELNQARRRDFLEGLILYYQLHLQGFKRPKSLEVLQQLFA